MVKENNTTATPTNNEIDLVKLVKMVWNGRKTITIGLIAGILIGVASSLLTPKEYSASIAVVPQTSGNKSVKLGGLSGLASMAGIDMESINSNNELSPVIYPQLLNSASFQLELMDKPLRFYKDKPAVTLYAYYAEEANKGLGNWLKKNTIGLLNPKRTDSNESPIIESNSPIKTTVQQEEIRELLRNKLSLEVLTKEGYLVLSSSLPKAEAAADLTQNAIQLLQKYITQIKIKKASDNLNFIEERYLEKKMEFEKAQISLAEYRDRNKNIVSALVRTNEEKLQSEYNMAYSVYSELAKQLEQAKIKIKEDTPVFSVLAPVVVPIKPSKPNKKVIVIIWTFLGGFIGLMLVFIKHYAKQVKEQWRRSNKKP